MARPTQVAHSVKGTSSKSKAFVKTVQPGGYVGDSVIILGNNLTVTTSVTFHGTAASFNRGVCNGDHGHGSSRRDHHAKVSRSTAMLSSAS